MLPPYVGFKRLVGDAHAAIALERGSFGATKLAAGHWDAGAGWAIEPGIQRATELAAGLCLGQGVGADERQACNEGDSGDKDGFHGW